MIKPIQEPLILNPIKAKNVNEQENYKTLYIFVFQHFPGEKIKQMKASGINSNLFLKMETSFGPLQSGSFTKLSLVDKM